MTRYSLLATRYCSKATRYLLPKVIRFTTGRTAMDAKMDAKTRDVLSRFKHRLEARYGTRMKSLFLFGSRARGDFRPDSDADVAVFIDRVADPIREQMAMCDDAYDIWMETGIRVEPWAFEEASLTNPDGHRAARLAKTIRSEGIRA